ncbi:hypothetical protein V6N13_074850 [Hibiscus sabdariffa]
MVLRDARDSFWNWKRQVNSDKHETYGVSRKGFRSTVEGDMVPEKTTLARRLDKGVVHSVNMKDAVVADLKRVVTVADEEKLDILRKCAIGFCRRTYSMLDLAKEFCAADSKWRRVVS